MSTFHLMLEEPELDYIGRMLAQRPYAEVVALIAKLQQQASNQNALFQHAPESATEQHMNAPTQGNGKDIGTVSE